MARVQHGDVLFDATTGKLKAGVTVSYRVHNGAPATVYAAETGGTTVPAVVTDQNGAWTAWLDAGRYDVTAGSTTRTIDLASAATELAQPKVVTDSQFGADPTNTTDSTAAFNAAVAAGSSYIPDGDYKISGVVTIPTSNVNTPNLLGAGSSRVRLHLGAGGQIAIGNRTGAGGIPSGGRVGGFTIDGGGVANVAGGGLYVGLITQHTFPDIRVVSCAGDGVVIEAAQNNTFEGLFAQLNAGNDLVLDYGAGGNVFDGHTELYGAGGYNLVFRQSGTPPAGTFATGPSGNLFLGGMIENSIGPSGSQNSGLVHHSAGSGNVLFVPDGLTASPATAPYSMVVMDVAGPGAVSTDLTLIGATLLDNNAHSIGLDMRGNTSVVLIGKTSFANLLVGIQSYNTDSVQMVGQLNWATVATKWQKNPSSPATSFQSVVRSFEGTRKDFVLQTSTDDMAVGYLVGEAGNRLQLNLTGVWYGDGTFAPFGVTGWEYFTPDAGTTKYSFTPQGVWVAGNLQHGTGKLGFFNKTAATQGATPVTLADVIALLQRYGLAP